MIKLLVGRRSSCATPNGFDGFVEQISAMWASEPNFTAQQLGAIKLPVTIAAGEHDEAILQVHTRELASAIPEATLIMMPGLSHFGMWQDPAAFNEQLRRFLD